MPGPEAPMTVDTGWDLLSPVTETIDGPAVCELIKVSGIVF